MEWGEGKELLIVDGFFLLHRHDTSEPCDTLINYLTIGNERNHEIFKSETGNPPEGWESEGQILNRRYFMATINLRNVPDDLHRKAKARAAMEGVSLKQLILRLLEEYLEGVC